MDTPSVRISASRKSAVKAERIATAVVTLAPSSNATRAAIWFEANVVAIPSSASTPTRGDKIAFMTLSRSAKNAGFSLILAFAAPALACEVPDDGSTPLRAAVTRVKYLAETEAWQKT